MLHSTVACCELFKPHVTPDSGHKIRAQPHEVETGIVMGGDSVINTPPVQAVLTCCQLILVIYSLVSIIIAQTALVAREQDVGNSVSNWLSPPLVEIQYVPVPVGQVGSCPSGAPTVLHGIQFPGVRGGLCACKAGAQFTDPDGRTYQEASSSLWCSTNQTRAGCQDETPIGGFRMPFWVDNILVCGRRAGPGPVITVSPFVERPVPANGTICPTGYRTCGQGSTAICFPLSEPGCPITRLWTASATDWDPVVSAGSDVFLLSDGRRLVAQRQTGELPVVETAFGFRGVCFGTTSSYGYLDMYASEYGNRVYDTSCGVGFDDSRYAVFANEAEDEFLRRHFVQNQDWCGATANQIALDVGGPCDSSDSICVTLNRRTRCQKLLSYATPPSRQGPLNIFYRREVPWRNDCPTSREALINARQPLTELVNKQHAVMTVNIVTSVFNILIYINVRWVALDRRGASTNDNTCWEWQLLFNLTSGDSPCCPMKGDAERQLLLFTKTWIDWGMKLGRLIPLILLLQTVDPVIATWQAMAFEACSDSITNATTSFLAQTLANLKTSHTGTITVDCLSIAISFLAWAWGMISKCFGRGGASAAPRKDESKPDAIAPTSGTSVPLGPPKETEGAPIVEAV